MAVAERRIRENLAEHYGQTCAPADSKKWEGKPNKLHYFSPSPGAGD